MVHSQALTFKNIPSQFHICSENEKEQPKGDNLIRHIKSVQKASFDAGGLTPPGCPAVYLRLYLCASTILTVLVDRLGPFMSIHPSGCPHQYQGWRKWCT